MPSFDLSGDFTFGAFTVVGVAGAYKIWQLFQWYPWLVANEKTWSQQIPNMGDNSKVVSRFLFVCLSRSRVVFLLFLTLRLCDVK